MSNTSSFVEDYQLLEKSVEKILFVCYNYCKKLVFFHKNV
jgi:hypothetical protein